jgi:hypothetical protein
MEDDMKFRKKPVVVDAEQFFQDSIPWPEGVQIQGADGAVCIKTLEGWLRVSDGDYIITGVKGERYPCKPDIFEMTYEAVT